MYDKYTMNVLYSSDNNYAQHLGASVYSLLKNNTEFEYINLFIVDNEIKKENKNKLNQIILNFPNSSINYIDFSKWKEKLNLNENMDWNISISSYARLFIANMLPKEVERVLYLDCDMIICDSLFDLWNSDLNNYVLGAIQDRVAVSIKNSVDVDGINPYFNAGLLLVDIVKWREQEIENKLIEFINNKNGNVLHHDQGTLNGIFNGKWKILPLRYNVMTILFLLNYQQMINRREDLSGYYSKEEVASAKKSPAIVHFTPSFTTRPWYKNCKHPLKNLYWEALQNTLWKNEEPQKDNSKWYIKLANAKGRILKK